MRASSLAILVLIAACAGPAPLRRAPLLDAHTADARAAVQGEAGAEPESLTPFETKLKAIQAAWEKRLGEPEKLLSFFDFSSPEMGKLRAAAAHKDFAASLAKDFSLNRVLAGAFVRNPGLQAAQKRLAATVEQYAQVTYLDTILRQYVSFLRTLHTRIGPTVPMDQVQKRFPFPGTLELKAALVGHAVEAARAKYEAALRDLVTNVRIAYADYVYLARAISITRETLRFLEQLEGTVRGKLAAGTAQKSHVLQTQVEISKLENDLITLKQDRETVRARIDTLLDLPPETPLGKPAKQKMETFPKKVEPLYLRAIKEQPDVELARARAARMAAMIELAEQATYPELSAGLAYFGGISHDNKGFSTRPKVKPDPWFGSKEAYLREAREAERAARRRIGAAKDKTLYRLKQAYVQLDTAKRLYDLYRDVQLSQARQAYSDAAAGYSADQVEFLNVIDALRRWLRFLLDADRAQRDYHQAYARLESAIGGPVARKAK